MKANRKSQKLFPFNVMIENHGGVIIHLKRWPHARRAMLSRGVNKKSQKMICLKGCCTVSSLFPEISLIDRYSFIRETDF